MTRATYRAADKRLGDDVTFSRFVKLPGRHDRTKAKRPPVLMPPDATGTRYQKAVVDPTDKPELLLSGFNNIKLGRDVRKGRFRGYHIFKATLEERATCPTTCGHWRDCYGNNMPFATRLKHGAALEARLPGEIARLLGKRGRVGIMVRLHELGDFYSVEYVQLWGRLLEEHPNLACWGYTARQPNSEIGNAIAELVLKYGDRFAIRWSDGGLETHSTVSISEPEECPPNAFVCPEQTDKTIGCGTCGACWATTRNVAFLDH